MKQIDALKELAEKVEAGTLPTTDDSWNAFGLSDDNLQAVALPLTVENAFRGNLDDAHSLHKAVLGDRWSVGLTQDDDKTWWCVLKEGFQTSYTGVKGAKQEIPARAWLLAIIKAKIAEIENDS